MLTKHEIKIVTEAIKLIATDKETFSCHALNKAQFGNYHCYGLAEKYAEYYGVQPHERSESWAHRFFNATEMYSLAYGEYAARLKEFRIMLLLNFMEGSKYV